MTVHIMRLSQVQSSLISLEKHEAISVLIITPLKPGVGVKGYVFLSEDKRLTGGISGAHSLELTATKNPSSCGTPPFPTCEDFGETVMTACLQSSTASLQQRCSINATCRYPSLHFFDSESNLDFF